MVQEHCTKLGRWQGLPSTNPFSYTFLPPILQRAPLKYVIIQLLNYQCVTDKIPPGVKEFTLTG